MNSSIGLNLSLAENLTLNGGSNSLGRDPKRLEKVGLVGIFTPNSEWQNYYGVGRNIGTHDLCIGEPVVFWRISFMLTLNKRLIASRAKTYIFKELSKAFLTIYTLLLFTPPVNYFFIIF